MSMQIEKELVRYQDDSFTKELNIICDVIPQVRGVANQVHKIVKVQLGYHLYSKEDVKLASVSMNKISSHLGSWRY
ncbi:hypothetical protein [Ignatzschineria cameli]|uniref:hypothetical protein n=1 Tax=Ignatzschineria cameli TaxID=2182793 RepID=UPI000D616320|nr:hypothetical protein [Ignatzschineria cameli]PWD83872.1 hypothetical protein DC080_07425 [Ignatzschineria cameli]